MDWKIIAALVVAVAIVVSGFFSSGGINFTGTGGAPNPPQNPQSGSNPIGDFASWVKGAASGVLSGTLSEKNINRTLQVSGSLAVQDNLQMSGTADSVEMQVSAPSSIIIGGERISLSAGAVSLKNFSGRIDAYINRTVFMEGGAEALGINGADIASITGKTAGIKISAFSDSTNISNITIGSFGFNASGSLDVGREKNGLNIGSEPLQIENFMGSLEISGTSLAIDGFSTKVLLNGKEKIVVG